MLEMSVQEFEETLGQVISKDNLWENEEYAIQPYYSSEFAREGIKIKYLQNRVCEIVINSQDFELNDFPCRDIIETLFDDDNGNVALLKSIYYDPTDKEMKVDSVYGDEFSKKASLEDELKKLTFQSDVEIYKEGKLYFMWAGGKDWNEKYHELATVNNSKNRKYRNIPLDLYNSGDLVEGKDYVLYPVSIKSDEFGEL